MAAIWMVGTDVCSTSIQNPVSGCYTPISCRQCLTLDGCLVDASGYCQRLSDAMSVAGYNDTKYTNAIAQNLTLPAAKGDARLQGTQKWTFEAKNATYCPDGDAVCAQCVAADFWAPYTPKARDSRFCVGANGCVCISACSHPEEWCETLYRRDHPTNSSTSSSSGPPSSTASPGLVSSSKSGSSAGASAAGRPTEDECRYSTSVDAVCRTYRSCSSCLLQEVHVSEFGYCQLNPIHDEYDPARDFRRAFERNMTLPDALNLNTTDPNSYQSWIFPAYEVRYCPASDETCLRCTRENFWTSYHDSRFCVGTDGCVCISNCRRPDDESTCRSSSSAKSSSSWDEVSLEQAALITGAVIAFAITASFLYKCRTKAEPLGPPRHNATATQLSAPPTPSGAADIQRLRPQTTFPVASALQRTANASTARPPAQLELYGWISHRQHLIDAETRRLNGADDFVPAREHLPRQFQS